MNWNIGKRIVEEEQHGKDRAEYGKQLLTNLSAELVKNFGAGYSERNLRNFRQFYLYFPEPEIWNACVPNLNWTHFRSLLRISDENARLWYLREASNEGWSSRTLDRNISTQYYHRLLQDRFDHLSERSQESERGEALEEQISNLEYASDGLEDAIDMLKEVIGEE